MTTERERIDKMLAEGKVSAEEAGRLRAALDRAEREEEARPGVADEGEADRLARPRLSRLALAGALGLPAAGVTFLFVMGLAIVFGAHEGRAIAGGFLMAVAVALVGVGLAIAGLVVTRRRPDRFSGRRLALGGIIAPLALAALLGVASAIAYDQAQKQMTAARSKAERAMRTDIAHHSVLQLWTRFVSNCASNSSRHATPERRNEALDSLEPDWAAEIELDGLSEEDRKTTVVSKHFIALVEANEELAMTTKEDVDIDAGRGVVSFEVGPRAKRVRILVPVKRVGDREWFFARAPLQFPNGEPEWPREPGRKPRQRGMKRVTVTVRRDGQLGFEQEGVPGSRRVKPEALADELKALVGTADRLAVEIRAAPETPHERVTALMEALAKAGVTDVTFRTE